MRAVTCAAAACSAASSSQPLSGSGGGVGGAGGNIAGVAAAARAAAPAALLSFGAPALPRAGAAPVPKATMPGAAAPAGLGARAGCDGGRAPAGGAHVGSPASGAPAAAGASGRTDGPSRAARRASASAANSAPGAPTGTSTTATPASGAPGAAAAAAVLSSAQRAAPVRQRPQRRGGYRGHALGGRCTAIDRTCSQDAGVPRQRGRRGRVRRRRPGRGLRAAPGRGRGLLGADRLLHGRGGRRDRGAAGHAARGRRLSGRALRRSVGRHAMQVHERGERHALLPGLRNVRNRGRQALAPVRRRGLLVRRRFWRSRH